MKKISDLKQGDVIYDIDFKQVKLYTYLCIHPTGHGKYHILIDQYEEPFRIYDEKLQSILDKGFETYEQAKLGLANSLEDFLTELRTEILIDRKKSKSSYEELNNKL